MSGFTRAFSHQPFSPLPFLSTILLTQTPCYPRCAACRGCCEVRMSIVDDLIENLVERNVIQANGTVTIALVDGGIHVRGQLFSTVRDQKKNKDILRVNLPVDADVRVGEIVIPVPPLK
jgi:hypothetical protein